jgi:hypothetical protein
MTDRLRQEIDDILQHMERREEEPPSDPGESIAVTCLYHSADDRDWQRLQQHLKAVQWQFQQESQRTVTWATYELNPKEPAAYREVLTQARQAILHAHIILIALSVDMQLTLQQHPRLDNTLLSRVAQAEQKKNTDHPPHVAGILMKAILWDRQRFLGMELLPRYQEPLATQHRKDAACVEIARHVLACAQATDRVFQAAAEH